MQAKLKTRPTDAHHPHGSSNATIVVTLLFAMGFGYFACVKPMTDQMRSMRRSMSCLQTRVAKLVKEADAAGEGASLLARLAEQRAAAEEAQQALEHIEALSRRVASQTRQIALLASSEDLMLATKRRITEQREVLGAAEHALSEAKAIEGKLITAEQRIADAAVAADHMRALCTRLVASRPLIEDAHTAGEDLATLQQRLLLAARATPAATSAVNRFAGLAEKLANATCRTPQATERLDQLEALQDRLLTGGAQSTRAVEALDVLTDLRRDVVAAEEQFQSLREVVLEVVLMQPAVDRAVATIGPLRQLAGLRYLDFKSLQVAMEKEEGNIR